MPTPIILVDGVTIEGNQMTSTQVCALTLQSIVGINDILWTVDCTPGSSATLSTARPLTPFATTLTLNGIGTYRITATANSNQAGNEVTVGTIYVPTARGLRIPIPGEEAEFGGTTYEWGPTIVDAIAAVSYARFGQDALSYGSTVTPVPTGFSYAVLGDVLNIGVTNGNEFTIAAPSPSYLAGQQMILVIQNTSGGAMGAISWSGVYKKAGGFVTPANNKQRMIAFTTTDGTNWVERTRSLSDLSI